MKGKTFLQNVRNMVKQSKVVQKKLHLRFFSVHHRKDVKVEFLGKKQPVARSVKPNSANKVYLKQQQKPQKMYPFSINEQFFCEMTDKKQKGFADLHKILAIEDYSLRAAQVTSVVLEKLLLPRYAFLKHSSVNFEPLLHAVFRPDNARFFQNLLENYLFKYQLNAARERHNSSFVCGESVNLVLRTLHAENLQKLEVIALD